MPIPDSQKYVESFSGTKYPYGNLSLSPGSPPSGYGEDYDQIFAANPYRDLNYRKSFWQSVASGLGFRTDYDKQMEQAQINAAEYDAGIFSIMQQNKFNSPEEQAMRMRAAGENPDLLGTGDVASAASPAEDPNGMSVSIGDEIQPLKLVGSITQGILDIIPQTLSFATNISQLRGIRLENDAKEVAFGNDILSMVKGFFSESITSQMYREAFEKKDWTNVLDASRKQQSYLADTFFHSKQARQRFNRAYALHQNSLVAELQKYTTYDEFEKARKSVLSQRASSFFSDDDETMMNLLSDFLQPIEEYQKTMNDINLKYAKKAQQLNLGEDRAVLEDTQIANQQKYENAIDPTLEAESQNAANRRAKMQEEIQAATETLFAALDAKLGEKDNWWSKIAMALLGMARAYFMSGMHMQFGRNQHYEVNGDTGVLTESGRSGFNLAF